MFEIFTTPPDSPIRRSRRLVLGTLAIGLPIVALIAILAQARNPTLVLLVGGIAVWFPLFGGTLLLSRRISNSALRKAALVATFTVFLTPSIVGGEGGVAPAPAIVVLFVPRHFFFGAIPLLVGAMFSAIIVTACTASDATKA